MSVRATLLRDGDDSAPFGLGLVEAGATLIVNRASEEARSSGICVGMRLVDLVAGGMDYDVSALRLRALNAVLSRHKSVTFVCSASIGEAAATSLAALDASISHEDSPVHKLRSLLSPAEVEELHAAAKELQLRQEPHTYDNVLINNSAEDMPFGLRPQHESVFLHENGFFRHNCPQLCRKLVSAVRRHADGGSSLGVRCIEYHTYRIGGALLDPEHRDMGSTLTMSCLLSDPSEMDGGTFITWEHGQPVYHDDLERGDAVVFHSERVHNVGAVMGGTRHSLVIELWDGPDNQTDRHS